MPSSFLPNRMVAQVQMQNRCFRVIRVSGGKPWNKEENGSPNSAWCNHENLEVALDHAFALANWQT